MEIKANITKPESLFSARASNNNNFTRENTFNTIKSGTTKKSNLKSKSTNEFSELPKYIIDEKRIPNFQTEMHRKIIGLLKILSDLI